jgi:hypothetical protein
MRIIKQSEHVQHLLKHGWDIDNALRNWEGCKNMYDEYNYLFPLAKEMPLHKWAVVMFQHRLDMDAYEAQEFYEVIVEGDYNGTCWTHEDLIEQYERGLEGFKYVYIEDYQGGGDND